MDVKQIKELCRSQGFRPNKKLGQNFLIDSNIREKILRTLPLGPDTNVIEIGAGFGMMTFALAGSCHRVVAVEKDPRICDIMASRLEDPGNIDLLKGDFLEMDLESCAEKDRDLLVYGNVPYYISTPIIEKVITCRKSVSGLYMVVQEELADRIASAPGSRDFGSISCYAQYFASVKKYFRISRNCFYPRPQVGSCLLGMDILDSPSVDVVDEELFFRVIRSAFRQRRKKIINPLISSGIQGLDRPGWREVLEKSGISESRRAEQLTLEDYAGIADVLSERGRVDF